MYPTVFIATFISVGLISGNVTGMKSKAVNEALREKTHTKHLQEQRTHYGHHEQKKSSTRTVWKGSLTSG